MRLKKTNTDFRKKLILIASVFLIMATLSCSRGGKDHSIGNDEYTKLGMPDHRKKWNSDDYSDAYITLGTLMEKSPLSLPRKSSKKSGEVFARIVNEENLAFAYDTVIPLKVRAYMIQHYPRIIGEAENLYLIEAKGKMVYSEEFIEILKFNLNIYHIMLDLSDMIDKSDDESLSDFKEGKTSVRYFYIKYITSMVDKVTRPEIISAEGFKELISVVCESVNSNSEWMTAQDKAAVAAALKSLAEKSGSKAIKNNLLNSISILTK